MIKICSLLITIIALLLYGIFKQSQVEKLESAVSTLKTENNQYKKHIVETQDRMDALKGKLSYLDVEAQSLKSDLEFIKSNPGYWSIPETEQDVKQLQSDIELAKNESD